MALSSSAKAGPSDVPAAEATPDVRRTPCDATASGAEDAQVRLSRGAAELFLCAHHFALCELALCLGGWQVTCDSRSLLR